MGKKINMTEEEIQQLIGYYQQGLSQINTGKKMNCSGHYVRKILKQYNIHIRTDSEQAPKYSYNENYFETIDSEDKAYWLGFIYADGYVSCGTKYQSNKLGIAIKLSDIEHLNKFKQHIQASHPINEYTSNTSYGKIKYCRIVLVGNKFVNNLINKGVSEHKSTIITFPTEEQVPKKFIYHFIRGYFDGNGSISIKKGKDKYVDSYRFSISSTKEFLISVQEIFNKNQKLQKRHDNEVNNYSIEIGGNQQVYKMLYKLYDNANIYLDRKYDRYLKLKEYILNIS